jgi:integrase
MPNLRFTKSAVSAIPHPISGQVIYRDTQLRGFGLLVGTKKKSYFVEGQVNSRTRRVSIGRADVFCPDVARKMALAFLSDMAMGKNPAEEKRRKAQEQVTLGQAFSAFFKARTNLSPNTVAIYQRTADVHLKDWRPKPIAHVSRQMVLNRHQRIGQMHGEMTANSAMRYFRSVYNFIAATQDDFPPNPVQILSQARAWYPEKRRQGIVANHDLPAWWAAVMQESERSRDILLIAIFTGMRRNEILNLRWENIDLVGQSLHIPSTKNGAALDLPLSDFLIDLLRARQRAAGPSEWVFPGTGKHGHVIETKGILARVARASGVKFTLHDLRRTFITIAESLNIPHYSLKRLLNHRVGGDVTGGYIVIDVERLRGPVEQVAKRILELAAGS